MTRPVHTPDRGDLVWPDFTPQAGHEQAGRRPALVISPRAYNQRTSLCLACPVASNAKGYPFEVALPPGLPIAGVVLSDHVKSLHWRVRRARFAGRVPADLVAEVQGKLAALVSSG